MGSRIDSKRILSVKHGSFIGKFAFPLIWTTALAAHDAATDLGIWSKSEALKNNTRWTFQDQSGLNLYSPLRKMDAYKDGETVILVKL